MLQFRVSLWVISQLPGGYRGLLADKLHLISFCLNRFQCELISLTRFEANRYYSVAIKSLIYLIVFMFCFAIVML